MTWIALYGRALRFLADHGDDAPLEAMIRALDAFDQGDRASHEEWLGIKKIIDDMGRVDNKTAH